MHSPSLQTVLSKLIALTNERDTAALELSLAQALHDLIYPADTDCHHSVVIYRAVDIEKQLFSLVVVGKKYKADQLPAAFKQSLSNCFKRGEVNEYVADGVLHTTLYPLKNAVGHTMAIIAIESPSADSQLHETIAMLLQIYQNFTGLINDNERDTLTGLLNRKTFDQRINKVLSQMQKAAKRKDDGLGHLHYLAIFDIDHFKHVNDDYGHLIGDEVLLLFSQLMTESFRDKDLLFRFGGEEFVGVFECASPPDIQAVLDRFREKVSHFDFPQVGKVTVSAGYTLINAFDAATQLIDRADVALYYAKNHGRNRISNYEQLIATGALKENKKEGDVELF